MIGIHIKVRQASMLHHEYINYDTAFTAEAIILGACFEFSTPHFLCEIAVAGNVCLSDLSTLDFSIGEPMGNSV